MGLNVSYYIVDENEIESCMSAGSDFDSFIQDRVTLDHEYRGFWFWHNSYGQGIKAWNPLLELVAILDTSEDNVCRRLLDPKQTLIAFHPSIANAIFQELKKISIHDIELATENVELTGRIAGTPGYHMISISHKESMVIEFMELLKAFYHAHWRKKGVIMRIE